MPQTCAPPVHGYHNHPTFAEMPRAVLLLLHYCVLPQVVLGSSIDEALQWAQQAGNLDPAAAQLVKDALAQKDQPFSSELTKCLPPAMAGFACGWRRAP